MAGVNVFRALLLAVIVASSWDGHAALMVVYVVAFLLGTAETLFDTAAQAMLPSLVERSRLEAANSRLFATELVNNQFAGPLIGGWLFTLAMMAPFALDACSFLVSAALIASISGRFRVERDGSARAETIVSGVRAGVSWLFGHRLLRTLSLLAGLTNTVAFAVIAVFVLYVQDVLRLSAIGYSVLLSIIGAGGIGGGLIAPLISRGVGTAGALRAVLALQAVSAAILAATTSVVLAGIVCAFYGASLGVWNVLVVSLRQRLVPDRLRGRIASVTRLIAWGGMPIGALLGGGVAAAVDLQAPFVVAAVALGVGLALAAPIVTRRAIEEAEANWP